MTNKHNNLMIRTTLKQTGTKYWELAKLLEISDGTLCRMLRDEIKEEEQKRICTLIRQHKPVLKEEQTVESELEGGGSTWWYVCGECHGEIGKGDAYCKHCGRRQIWDK